MDTPKTHTFMVWQTSTADAKPRVVEAVIGPDAAACAALEGPDEYEDLVSDDLSVLGGRPCE